MKINDYSFDQIKVNDEFQFARTITKEDVANFAKLSGDFNPLHMDGEFANTTIFKGTKIHGMLAGSLFSTLLGMVCPGKRNFYLSQSLNFKLPIEPETELIVKGRVKKKIDSVKVMVVETTITVDGKIVIDGEAKVKLLDY